MWEMNSQQGISEKQNKACIHCHALRRCHRILATMFIEEILEEEHNKMQQILIDNYMKDPFYVYGDKSNVSSSSEETDDQVCGIALDYYKKKDEMY